ncbi:MAG: hypothetical protein LH613_05045 [Chamaesiphon sp.]|nr:hypothetical protein [Chamaesiphon sp.]
MNRHSAGASVRLTKFRDRIERLETRIEDRSKRIDRKFDIVVRQIAVQAQDCLTIDPNPKYLARFPPDFESGDLLTFIAKPEPKSIGCDNF